MKNTAETIEFFTPTLGLEIDPYIKARQKQGIHHLGRYHWACRVLANTKPQTVLDIACGAGYGSAIMAAAFPETHVVGADYDERAVQYARQHYTAPNLEFQQGDIVLWRGDNEPLGTYDAITSFDTLEHLLHREIAMQSVADNLNADGVLLLSTPCGHGTSRLYPAWQHHKLEFSYRDLYSFLMRFFRVVLYPGHPAYVGLDYWETVVNAGEQRYLTRMNPVICSGPIRSAKPPYPVL